MPIGYGGRQEKGTILSMDVDTANAFGKEYVVEVDSAEGAVVASAKVEIPLEKMKLKELQLKAKELKLDASGTKPDLIERISLHLEG